MRAIGANNPIEIDIFDVENTTDGILLCSDGLTNMLTDEQIEKYSDMFGIPENISQEEVQDDIWFSVIGFDQ